MSLQIINQKTYNDERFNVMDSRSILQRDRPILGYGQYIADQPQVLPSTTRIQVLNNAQDSETFFTENLWYPLINRFNLQDAKVGDIMSINIVLAAVPSGSVLQLAIQLDYSPALDGSLVISQTVKRLVISAGSATRGIEANFKFVVSQAMKDNGIAVMVTPFAPYVLSYIRFIAKRFTIPT